MLWWHHHHHHWLGSRDHRKTVALADLRIILHQLHLLHLLKLEKLHLLLPLKLLLLKTQHRHGCSRVWHKVGSCTGWSSLRYATQTCTQTGSYCQQMWPIQSRVNLAPRVARHFLNKFRLVPKKQLVKVSASLGASWRTVETPTIELSCEARKLASFKEMRKDRVGKSFLFVDLEAISVR